MKCVNCGGVIAASGCRLCGAGRITPAHDKERWYEKAFSDQATEILRLTEQNRRLLEACREILASCQADLTANPWKSRPGYGYCEPQITVAEVNELRTLIAECEKETTDGR